MLAVLGTEAPHATCFPSKKQAVLHAWAVQGRIFTDAALPELSERERRAAYLGMAATLAALHSVDPAEVGLQGFGKASGYCQRQARTLSACPIQKPYTLHSIHRPCSHQPTAAKLEAVEVSLRLHCFQTASFMVGFPAGLALGAAVPRAADGAAAAGDGAPGGVAAGACAGRGRRPRAHPHLPRRLPVLAHPPLSHFRWP